jgi:serine protease Do
MKPFWIGALFSAAAAPCAAQPEESTLGKLEDDLSSAIEQARRSVVLITVRLAPQADQPPESRTFSGVVYSADGYVVTDSGGVEAAREIRVQWGDRIARGEHVASDRHTGVAVLKVDARGLTPAAFADGRCAPGTCAITVGNGLGLRGAASFGFVSGVERTIVSGGRSYEDLIQMTTAVHPGDGGGFVGDSAGRFIGMVHSVWTGKDPAPAPQACVSFAVPAEWVRFAADRIIKHRRMVRGWIGLTVRALDAAVRDHLGLAEGEGAEVVRVEKGGPADRGALQARDVLVELDGEAVRDLGALHRKIVRVEKPTRMRFAFLRDRERREAEVEVELAPER